MEKHKKDVFVQTQKTGETKWSPSAWTRKANNITCRNHGKESTKNSYLLHLQTRNGVPNGIRHGDAMGCKVMQWKRKKIERQKQKGEN
jgi:hypothetical protein